MADNDRDPNQAPITYSGSVFTSIDPSNNAVRMQFITGSGVGGDVVELNPSDGSAVWNNSVWVGPGQVSSVLDQLGAGYQVGNMTGIDLNTPDAVQAALGLPEIIVGWNAINTFATSVTKALGLPDTVDPAPTPAPAVDYYAGPYGIGQGMDTYGTGNNQDPLGGFSDGRGGYFS